MQKSRWIIWGILSCTVFLLFFTLYLGTPPLMRSSQITLAIFGSPIVFSLFFLGFMWFEDKRNRKDYIIKDGYTLQKTLDNGHTIWVQNFKNLVWICELNAQDYVVSIKRYEQKEIEVLYSLQNKLIEKEV